MMFCKTFAVMTLCVLVAAISGCGDDASDQTEQPRENVTAEGEKNDSSAVVPAGSSPLPQDNPVAGQYGDGTEATGAWVGELPWDNVVSMESFSGDTTDQQLAAAMEHVSAAGGGVVYLPAGTYELNEDVTLPDGVILRGANPVGEKSAISDSYELRTRLEFPKYEYDPQSNDGQGTAIETAFRKISADPRADGVGLVNLAINRAHVHFPEEESHNTGRNRLIFGCILTNTAAADAGVPDERFYHRPHQRWTARHRAAIGVYSGENLFIANNRLPESGDDNFTIPDYRLVQPQRNSQGFRIDEHPYEVVTIEDAVVFDYDNRPGIYANAFGIGGVGGSHDNGTPETHPWGFRKGTVIRDNYIYCTGRTAIHFTGDGTVAADNVIRFPSGLWRPTCTGRVTSDGSSTNDNRALTMRGYRWIARGNDYEVHSNQAYNRNIKINDGEGIMHENHQNSIVRDGKVIDNVGNRYLCFWAAPVNGLEVRGNRITAGGNAIFVLGRDRDVSNVTIERNELTQGNIAVTGKDPRNIVIRDNRYTGEGTGKVIVDDLDWDIADNEGFEVELRN